LGPLKREGVVWERRTHKSGVVGLFRQEFTNFFNEIDKLGKKSNPKLGMEVR